MTSTCQSMEHLLTIVKDVYTNFNKCITSKTFKPEDVRIIWRTVDAYHQLMKSFGVTSKIEALQKLKANNEECEDEISQLNLLENEIDVLVKSFDDEQMAVTQPSAGDSLNFEFTLTNVATLEEKCIRDICEENAFTLFILLRHLA